MAAIDRLYREERKQADDSYANPVWATVAICVVLVLVLTFLHASRDARTSEAASTLLGVVDPLVTVLALALLALVYLELRMLNETWRKWFHWSVLMDTAPEEEANGQDMDGPGAMPRDVNDE